MKSFSTTTDVVAFLTSITHRLVNERGLVQSEEFAFSEKVWRTGRIVLPDQRRAVVAWNDKDGQLLIGEAK